MTPQERPGAPGDAPPPAGGGQRGDAVVDATMPDPARTLTDAERTHWRHYEPLSLPPILHAALEAFAENGYPGSTVRDIASRVGMTVPAIYYHYRNKQDLLVTLIFASILDILARCREAAEEAGDSREDQLAALVECIVLSMANRRHLAFLDSEIRSLDTENHRRYVAYRDELQALLRGTIADGCEEGVFGTPHPPETSRAILAMCQGVAVWYRPEGPLDPPQIAQRYVVIALDAVRWHAAR